MSIDQSNPVTKIIAQLLMNDGLMQLAANSPPQGNVRRLQLIDGQWVPSRGIGPGRVVTPYDDPMPRQQPRTGTDADFQR